MNRKFKRAAFIRHIYFFTVTHHQLNVSLQNKQTLIIITVFEMQFRSAGFCQSCEKQTFSFEENITA